MSDAPQHLDGTVLKNTVDGRQVLSSYLDDGESLVNRDNDAIAERANKEADKDDSKKSAAKHSDKAASSAE